MPTNISLPSIQQARERIAAAIQHPPCKFSEALSEKTGARVHVKFENLQATGSFKERGAANRLLQLNTEERKRGVVAASAGNHGLGLAYQAKRLGIPATVVMPKGAPLIKQTNVKRLGGKVVLHGDTYEEAVAKAREIEQEGKKVRVHGFDDPDVIIGQGTLGLELVEEITELDGVLVPVGGGGLIAGVGVAIKSLKPTVKIIGVEPERCASMAAALKAARPVAVNAQPTIADGLEVNCVGQWPLDTARDVIDEMVTVSEDEIAQAILTLVETEKTVVEGAGAAGLAALLGGKTNLKGKNIAVPLCGGNIDVNIMSRIIDRGLAKDGRLVWLRTFVSDKPGALAALSRVIADSGASVKDVFHNRAFGRVELGGVEINWVLETRGHDHIAELMEKLREKHVPARTFENV